MIQCTSVSTVGGGGSVGNSDGYKHASDATERHNFNTATRHICIYSG